LNWLWNIIFNIFFSFSNYLYTGPYSKGGGSSWGLTPPPHDLTNRCTFVRSCLYIIHRSNLKKKNIQQPPLPSLKIPEYAPVYALNHTHTCFYCGYKKDSGLATKWILENISVAQIWQRKIWIYVDKHIVYCEKRVYTL